MNLTMDRFPKEARMVVTVTLSRKMRFRLWCALKLVDLAAWILGMGTDYVEKEDGDGEPNGAA